METLSAPLAGILGLGAPELMVILVIMLVLFGGAKLPELAKGLGQSIKEFKKAAKEDPEEGKSSEAKKTVEAAKTHGSN
ncbi:MAG TPA: twin-arginine translocase TatA/TatE family subunit [Opitutaceae bacterium]|nr:twin-arginine translocase TatA/TatE family subunit [Opitutaceae bacterium]